MFKTCVICGQEFEGRDSRQKTCGTECRAEYLRRYKNEWFRKNRRAHRYDFEWHERQNVQRRKRELKKILAEEE